MPARLQSSATSRTSKLGARVAKQQRSQETQRKILESACEVFVERGYDGATLSLIAERASVKQPLVSYHFHSKEALWIAVVGWVLDRFFKRIQPNLSALKGLDAATRVKLIFQDFVRFNAEFPETLEFMIVTNKRRGASLNKIVEERLRPIYESLIELIEEAQKTGAMVAGDPAQVYYSMVGVASLMFSVRNEFKQLTNREPFESTVIEAQADLIGRLFFPSSDQGN